MELCYEVFESKQALNECLTQRKKTVFAILLNALNIPRFQSHRFFLKCFKLLETLFFLLRQLVPIF